MFGCKASGGDGGVNELSEWTVFEWVGFAAASAGVFGLSAGAVLSGWVYGETVETASGGGGNASRA